MKICIVIPVFNEEKAIGRVVSQLKALNYDVVVVDDGSKDKSARLAKENGAILIENGLNYGKGYSLQRAFEYALIHDYTGVIAMDGDGQHAIEDIETFIEAAKENPGSIINGNRMADSANMPFVRRMTNKGMSFLISMVCRQKIPDTQCGYRYIGCEVLRNIELTSKAFQIETEILIKASKKGFKVFSVAVKTIYGDEKSKINPFIDTFRFIVYFFKELLNIK